MAKYSNVGMTCSTIESLTKLLYASPFSAHASGERIMKQVTSAAVSRHGDGKILLPGKGEELNRSTPILDTSYGKTFAVSFTFRRSFVMTPAEF